MSRRPSTKGHFTIFRRKGNPVWHFHITDENGTRHTYSTGTVTKVDAMAYIVRMIETQDYSPQSKKPVLTLSRFSVGFYAMDGEYVKNRIARGFKFSEKLSDTQTSALTRHVLRYMGDVPLTRLTAAEINTWLLALPSKEDIANKTANNALTILRQVLDQAMEMDLIQKNPARSVKPLNKHAKTTKRQLRRVAFTMDQVKQLFSIQWKHRHAMVACMIAAGTGMRLGEVRALTVDQIHDDYIEVDASIAEKEGRKTTKSGFARIVPIDMGLRYLIGTVMPEQGYIFSYDGIHPFGKNTITDALKKRMKELGIEAKPGEQLSFHSFRHYFNTRLIAGGLSGEKVRAVIGHESEEMTEHYLHLKSSDMEEVKSIQRIALGL